MAVHAEDFRTHHKPIRAARACLAEALGLALKLSAGTARYQIMALDLLGDLVADLGEHERALGLREQALRLARVSAAHSHLGPAARLVRHQRRGSARSE
jgi:hypothetical protein